MTIDEGAGPVLGEPNPYDWPPVRVTGTEQRLAWIDGVLPGVEQVRQGLWSLPVIIPNNPLRYVLTYVYELSDGLAVIDPGWPTGDSWDDLVGGLRVIGADVTDVRSILVTHGHPDHVGLAGRLREESGAWIGMHRADAPMLGAMSAPADRPREIDWSWMRRRGGPARETARPEPPFDLRELAACKPDAFIEDGDRPLLPHVDLRAVWTPGHTPGHLCFHDAEAGILLTGDHVLPRISPNISLYDDDGTDPLSDFLASLEMLAELPIAEVLPAHEYRFAGLGARVAELVSHHEQRLKEIAAVVAAEPDATTWWIASQLTWSRSWGEIGAMRPSAVSETFAHLTTLKRRGTVANLGEQVDRWRIV
jgi:glyoxylase-like metal-dependent hydrolase (beta-lactamase superfamily II)